MSRDKMLVQMGCAPTSEVVRLNQPTPKNLEGPCAGRQTTSGFAGDAVVSVAGAASTVTDVPKETLSLPMVQTILALAGVEVSEEVSLNPVGGLRPDPMDPTVVHDLT
jgi:hypothetical protein